MITIMNYIRTARLYFLMIIYYYYTADYLLQDRKGRWHCDCQETGRRKTLLKIYGPNHVTARHFLEYKDKKTRAWNQTQRNLE